MKALDPLPYKRFTKKASPQLPIAKAPLARLQPDDAILRNLLRINSFFKTQQIATDIPRFSLVVSASTSYAN
jgi:hypothetical protein